MKHLKPYIASIIFLLGSSSLATASERGSGQGPRHGPPPQEAFDACLEATENQTCEVILPNNESLAGTCATPPRGDQLVCVPDEHRAHQERGQRD